MKSFFQAKRSQGVGLPNTHPWPAWESVMVPPAEGGYIGHPLLRVSLVLQ